MTAWYVAPALDELRDNINAAHPGRDRSSDGAIGDAAHAARKSDHNPAPDGRGGRIVRARDFDVDGIPVRPILDVLERDPRTGLLIYNHRYWTRGHGWRPYSGINPHTGHFHISVRVGAAYELDTRPWNLEDDMPLSKDEIAAIAAAAATETWKRPVRGLDGKTYQIGATVQTLAHNAQRAATDAAVARRLAESAAKGVRLTDAEIARIAKETAEQVDAATASEIAAQLTITTKEN